MAKERTRVRGRRVVTTIIIIIAIMLYALVSYIDTHYTREAIVTNVEQSLVTATDDDGNMWQFKATNMYEGECIKMTMHNNHTIMNYDDEVVDVKVLVEVK